MRKNRVMKCPLIDMMQVKRKERLSYDYRSDGKIEIFRWNDDSVVTLRSNAYSVEPVGTVKRLVKGIGKSNLDQPAVIVAYNQAMGGTNLLNRSLSDLRPVIRGKKWYWSLVINALNIAFVYSWRVFQIVSGEPMPQKSYRRQIVRILIRRAHPEIINVHSRPSENFRIPDEIRFDGGRHYSISCPVRR